MKNILLLLLLLPALIFGADEPSQDFLDTFYQSAEELSQDFLDTTALAEQGLAYAQYNLGTMYYKGIGVSENAAEAVKWFRLAAAQGEYEAQYNLGDMYNFGVGVLENDAEAVKWYRLAAKQGHPDAQYNLGSMYFNGDGVPQNNIRAYMWYYVSEAQFDFFLSNESEDVADKMTQEQLAQGQELATRCFESDFQDCPP